MRAKQFFIQCIYMIWKIMSPITRHEKSELNIENVERSLLLKKLRFLSGESAGGYASRLGIPEADLQGYETAQLVIPQSIILKALGEQNLGVEALKAGELDRLLEQRPSSTDFFKPGKANVSHSDFFELTHFYSLIGDPGVRGNVKEMVKMMSLELPPSGKVSVKKQRRGKS